LQGISITCFDLSWIGCQLVTVASAKRGLCG